MPDRGGGRSKERSSRLACGLSGQDGQIKNRKTLDAQLRKRPRLACSI